MGESKRKKSLSPNWEQTKRQYRWTLSRLNTQIDYAIAAGYQVVVLIVEPEQARRIHQISRGKIFKLPVVVCVEVPIEPESSPSMGMRDKLAGGLQ